MKSVTSIIRYALGMLGVSMFIVAGGIAFASVKTPTPSVDPCATPSPTKTPIVLKDVDKTPTPSPKVCPTPTPTATPVVPNVTNVTNTTVNNPVRALPAVGGSGHLNPQTN